MDRTFRAIEKKAKIRTNKELRKIPFYDGEVEDDYLTYSFSIHMFNEDFKDYLATAIKYALESFIANLQIESKTISSIDELTDDRITYYSANLEFYLKYYTNSNTIKEINKKIDKKTKVLKSNLIGYYGFTSDNPKLKCSISDVEIRYLNNEELLYELEQCRREDSKYSFDGYIGSKDEIFKMLETYKVKMIFTFRYKYILDYNKMYELDIDKLESSE